MSPLHVDCSIEFQKYYTIRVTFSDELLCTEFRQYFTTLEVSNYTIKRRNGTRELHETVRDVELCLGYSDTSVVLYAGLLDYVAVWLGHLKRTGQYTFSLKSTIPQVAPVQLNSKWQQVMGHREDQQEDIVSLTSQFGGIAAQYTGFGKTVMIMAIADLLPGNTLIMSPSNSARDEILYRAKEYDLDVGSFDPGKAINVVNPIGFAKSKQLTSAAVQEYMKSVSVLLIDECHHIGNNSYSTVFAELPNVARSYGFSASPDVISGSKFTPGHTTPRDMGVRGSQIIGHTGCSMIRRAPVTPVKIVKVQSKISDASVKKLKVDSWIELLDKMVAHPRLADVISTVFAMFPDIRFYIPILKKESGIELYKYLTKSTHRHHGIWWTADEFFPAHDPSLSHLDYVKKNMHEYRFLMTTSHAFESIDVPILGGVIPLIGANFRMIMQPAGRSSRGAELTYVLLYDYNNSLVLSQTKERYRTITREYNVISEEVVKLS